MKKITLGSLLSCSAFCCALSFLLINAQLTSADTLTETGSFSDISTSEFYSSPGSPPTGFSFSTELITGINKFNPALGTLNSVTLIAEFSSDLEITVFADDVIDEEFDHFVEFDGDFVQVFIGYSPGGSTSTFVSLETTYGASASCGGGPFDGPCTDSLFDSDFVSGTDEISSFSAFNVTDFVGVGEVTALDANIAVPGDGVFTLDNVDTASADLMASMTFLNLSVEYDFTPIPEPGSLVLVLLGSGLVVSRWGRR